MLSLHKKMPLIYPNDFQCSSVHSQHICKAETKRFPIYPAWQVSPSLQSCLFPQTHHWTSFVNADLSAELSYHMAGSHVIYVMFTSLPMEE